MNKFLPLMIIGAAAAATAVVTLIKRRNEREEASIVTLEDMGRVTKLQPNVDVLVHEAIETLQSISSESVRLTHEFSFNDEDNFFSVVRVLKERGYSLDDVGHLSAKVSQSIERNESRLADELKESYRLIVENDGKYESFKLTGI